MNIEKSTHNASLYSLDVLNQFSYQLELEQKYIARIQI
jgi:hypothetical protein